MKHLFDITMSDILESITTPEVWLTFKAFCVDDEKTHRYQANLNTGNIYREKKVTYLDDAIIIPAHKSRFAIYQSLNLQRSLDFIGVLCTQTVYIAQYDVLALVTYLCDCGNIMPNESNNNQTISERKQTHEENAISMEATTESGSIGRLVRNNKNWKKLNKNERVTVLSVEIINRNKENKMIHLNPQIRLFCSETPITCFDSKKKISTGYLDIDVVSKYFGEVYIGANNYKTIKTEQDFVHFMKTAVIKRKNSPNQSKIEELTSIVLPDVRNANQYYNFAYVSRVNDEYAVIRWIENGTEHKRLYVNKKEHLYCRVDTNGNWCYYHGKMNASSFDVEYIYLESAEVLDGTKMEYFKSICSKIPDCIIAKALYVLIMYPDFERIYKAGFERVCESFLNSDCQFNWIRYSKNYFGGCYNDKETNLHKMIGLNKYQINRFIQAHYSASMSPMPRHMKNIFNMDSLCDVDNDSFDMVFNFVSNVLNKQKEMSQIYGNLFVKSKYLNDTSKVLVHPYVVTDILTWISELYSTKVMLMMASKLRSCYDIPMDIASPRRYFYSEGNRASLAEVLRDVLMMIRITHSQDIIKPYFDTPEDLLRMHETLVEVLNVEREKKDKELYDSAKEGFEKRKSIWKKWEYENDKYIVISPNTPIDVAAEGIALHHCVKSYISTIAEGKTNILFLREKVTPEKPFFTIEVSNDKSVRQIHGFDNRLVESEPGLNEFVQEWATKVKVKLGKINAVLAHE